jgi:phenylalanyl-tRNA synthetase beta subunit
MLLQRDENHIKIKFSKEKRLNMLRSWLLPSLLSNASKSLHEKLPQKIFELDLAFSIVGSKPVEEYHLAGIIVDPKQTSTK